MLGVSRTTVIAAYDALREEAWVESRRGSGTRVRSPALPAAPSLSAAPALPAIPPLPPTGANAPGSPSEPPDGDGPARRARRNAIFRGLVDAAEGPHLDLRGAHLPAAEPFVSEALAGAMRDMPGALAHHGYFGLGLPALRQAIAVHLSAGGLPTTPEQVLVTSGAQQALCLVAALYVQPGDAVAIEDPTYPGAIDVFGAARARLLPIPVTPDGASLPHLRDAVARQAPRLIYVIPSFHNPTGALMPVAERRALARLAADSGTPVVEDLTLADLDLDLPPPPPIAAILPGAPVIAVGSLSKLVWGGLRIGWLRAEAPVVARLARLKVLADLGAAVPSQLLATHLLPRAAAIRDMRRRQLGAQREALGEALAAVLPEWTWRRPTGGLCLWVRLPRGNAEEFARLALRHGVAVVPGPSCSPRESWESYLRLPFTVDADRLREAAERLARAWEAYLPPAGAGETRFAVSGQPAPPPALDVLV
jgi:DNA-binding transcriptional MocR family regulator